MARVKFSALVTSINGSVGGTTFQRNAYGITMKNKPIMTIPRTQYQNVSKSLISQAATRWRTLSNAQRQTYIDYANTFPVATRLDPSAYLNGYNFFMKYSTLRLLAGLAILNTITLTQYNLTVTGIDLDDLGATVDFSFTQSAMSGSWNVYIFMSPQIPEYTKPRTNKTRYIKRLASVAGVQSTPISSEYLSRFGQAINAHDWVYVDVTFQNNVSGQMFEWPTQVVNVNP